MNFTNTVSFLRDTKSIGELSELVVATALSRAGNLISMPVGENARYDLIIDKDGRLSRVQVKAGRLRNGAILFNCYSVHTHSADRLKTYRGSIEFFGVYCPEVQSVFLIPVEDVPERCYASLRWEPSKNAQHSRIRWAHQYLVSSESASVTLVGTGASDSVSARDGSVPS